MCILVHILILLLGELLVLLTFELLTNHGPEMGVKGMATTANITKSEKGDTEFANSDLLLANN